MRLNAVLSGNTPLNWAQKRCFPKVRFKSSKLKRTAVFRHHAEGTNTKTNLSWLMGWQVSWSQLELAGESFASKVCASPPVQEKVFPPIHVLPPRLSMRMFALQRVCSCVVWGFFSPPLSFPFVVEGGGRGRSHQLDFDARSTNSSAQ